VNSSILNLTVKQKNKNCYYLWYPLTMMKKLKLYLETSIWNFYFADDAVVKQMATLQFFEKLK